MCFGSDGPTYVPNPNVHTATYDPGTAPVSQSAATGTDPDAPKNQSTQIEAPVQTTPAKLDLTNKGSGLSITQ